MDASDGQEIEDHQPVVVGIGEETDSHLEKQTNEYEENHGNVKGVESVVVIGTLSQITIDGTVNLESEKNDGTVNLESEKNEKEKDMVYFSDKAGDDRQQDHKDGEMENSECELHVKDISDIIASDSEQDITMNDLSCSDWIMDNTECSSVALEDCNSESTTGQTKGKSEHFCENTGIKSTDSDKGIHNPEKKKRKFSLEARNTLREFFSHTRYPSSAEVKKLSKSLNEPYIKIQNWFGGSRFKLNRQEKYSGKDETKIKSKKKKDYLTVDQINELKQFDTYPNDAEILSLSKKFNVSVRCMKQCLVFLKTSKNCSSKKITQSSEKTSKTNLENISTKTRQKLADYFENTTHYPSITQICDLNQKLNLPYATVNSWFINARKTSKSLNASLAYDAIISSPTTKKRFVKRSYPSSKPIASENVFKSMRSICEDSSEEVLPCLMDIEDQTISNEAANTSTTTTSLIHKSMEKLEAESFCTSNIISNKQKSSNNSSLIDCHSSENCNKSFIINSQSSIKDNNNISVNSQSSNGTNDFILNNQQSSSKGINCKHDNTEICVDYNNSEHITHTPSNVNWSQDNQSGHDDTSDYGQAMIKPSKKAIASVRPHSFVYDKNNNSKTQKIQKSSEQELLERKLQSMSVPSSPSNSTNNGDPISEDSNYLQNDNISKTTDSTVLKTQVSKNKKFSVANKHVAENESESTFVQSDQVSESENSSVQNIVSINAKPKSRSLCINNLTVPPNNDDTSESENNYFIKDSSLANESIQSKNIIKGLPRWKERTLINYAEIKTDSPTWSEVAELSSSLDLPKQSVIMWFYQANVSGTKYPRNLSNSELGFDNTTLSLNQTIPKSNSHQHTASPSTKNELSLKSCKSRTNNRKKGFARPCSIKESKTERLDPYKAPLIKPKKPYLPIAFNFTKKKTINNSSDVSQSGDRKENKCKGNRVNKKSSKKKHRVNTGINRGKSLFPERESSSSHSVKKNLFQKIKEVRLLDTERVQSGKTKGIHSKLAVSSARPGRNGLKRRKSNVCRSLNVSKTVDSGRLSYSSSFTSSKSQEMSKMLTFSATRKDVIPTPQNKTSLKTNNPTPQNKTSLKTNNPTPQKTSLKTNNPTPQKTSLKTNNPTPQNKTSLKTNRKFQYCRVGCIMCKPIQSKQNKTILQRLYDLNNSPSSTQMMEISNALKITYSSVIMWFNHMRRKNGLSALEEQEGETHRSTVHSKLLGVLKRISVRTCTVKLHRCDYIPSRYVNELENYLLYRKPPTLKEIRMLARCINCDPETVLFWLRRRQAEEKINDSDCTITSMEIKQEKSTCQEQVKVIDVEKTYKDSGGFSNEQLDVMETSPQAVKSPEGSLKTKRGHFFSGEKMEVEVIATEISDRSRQQYKQCNTAETTGKGQSLSPVPTATIMPTQPFPTPTTVSVNPMAAVTAHTATNDGHLPLRSTHIANFFGPSPFCIQKLEKIWKSNQNPSVGEMEVMANILDVDFMEIARWFRDARKERISSNIV